MAGSSVLILQGDFMVTVEVSQDKELFMAVDLYWGDNLEMSDHWVVTWGIDCGHLLFISWS